MKKILVAAVVGFALAVSANVATAYVAVVATAVPITAAVTEDQTRLGDAVRSAVQDVLDHAVGFTPTLVTLQKATVVGDRLYILVLIADEDGESVIEALTHLAPGNTPDHEDGSRDAPGHSDGASNPRDNTPSKATPELAPTSKASTL